MYLSYLIFTLGPWTIWVTVHTVVFCQVGAVFQEFGRLVLQRLNSCNLRPSKKWETFFDSIQGVLYLVSNWRSLASSSVPIIAILTLDFLECHVKRHEEPVKGPRGLTVACIRWLGPDFDPQSTPRCVQTKYFGHPKIKKSLK